MKKKFLIHCSTAWCGMDEEYPALAYNGDQLDDLAEQLAYDNFLSYDLWNDIASENGYDPDEMSEEEWDILQSRVNETDYYSYTIEEYDGDEEEWNSYGEPYEV